MRSMVLLEPDDLQTLRRGQTLALTVGAQTLTVGYAGRVTKNGGAPAPESVGPTEVQTERQRRTCPTCGKVFSTRKRMGEHSLRTHKKGLQRLAAGSVPGPRRHYTEAFRRAAVRRIRAGAKIPLLARTLRVPEGMLYKWRRGIGIKGPAKVTA